MKKHLKVSLSFMLVFVLIFSFSLASLAAPAPALSYLEVTGVISSQSPSIENISRYQFSTTNDHGGAELYIRTIEYGYGYSRVAKMNGTVLPLYSSSTFDSNGDSIVDGYVCWWNASGYNSGTFTYQNTSTNSPWNTMSDSITIK